MKYKTQNFLYLLFIFLFQTVIQPTIMLPRFEDSPARETYTGKPATLEVKSQPRDRRFRTLLREEAETSIHTLNVLLWEPPTPRLLYTAYGAIPEDHYDEYYEKNQIFQADWSLLNNLLDDGIHHGGEHAE